MGDLVTPSTPPRLPWEDDFVNEVLARLDREEGEADWLDEAVGGRAQPPNQGVSADLVQARVTSAIIEQLRRWGFDINRVRSNQPQVRARDEVAGLNRPDIQAVHPRKRWRVNIEVDTKRSSLDQHRNVVTARDPRARSVFLLIHPETGAIQEKQIWDPKRKKLLRPRRGALELRDLFDPIDDDLDGALTDLVMDQLM